MLRSQKGFTVIELLIVVAIVGIVVGTILGICTLVAGNFWFTEDSVLRELQLSNPDAKIVKTQRNIWAYSDIAVETPEGVLVAYKLDTSILGNYDFHLVGKFPAWDGFDAF